MLKLIKCALTMICMICQSVCDMHLLPWRPIKEIYLPLLSLSSSSMSSPPCAGSAAEPSSRATHHRHFEGSQGGALTVATWDPDGSPLQFCDYSYALRTSSNIQDGFYKYNTSAVFCRAPSLNPVRAINYT